MNNIRFGYSLSERWRVSINLNWGPDGQDSINLQLIEHHDYEEMYAVGDDVPLGGDD